MLGTKASSLKLEEIRDFYRTPRDNDQKVGWAGKYLYEPLAVPIAAFFLRYTSISANQITVGWILIGIFACFFLAIPSAMTTLLGCFCLYMHRVVDYADGIVARAKHNISSAGVFLDRVGHDLIYPSTLFALALRSTKIFQPTFILTIGFLASIGFFLYNNNRRAKILSYLMWQRQQKYSRFSELISEIHLYYQNPKLPNYNVSKTYLLKSIFHRIQWIWGPEYYVIIVYVASLLNNLHWLPIFYALTALPLLVVSVYHQSHCGDGWVEEFLIEPQSASNWH